MGRDFTSPAGNSSNPHTIRLQGPWDYEPLARVDVHPDDGITREHLDELPPPGRVQLPADWDETLGVGFRGRVRCRRRFGQPTGLTSTDRVNLCIEQINEPSNVILNDTPLEDGEHDGKLGQYNVTSILRDRNVLTIELRSLESCPSNMLIGEVQLEIHSMLGS